MFVLDFLPKEYLRGGPEKSIAIFTAGWAMKFVPLLGKALAEMALCGKSEYARKEFAITRRDPKTGKGIIVDKTEGVEALRISSSGPKKQAKGSSFRR